MKFSQILIITVLSFAASCSIAQTKGVAAATTGLRAIQKKYGLNPSSALLSRVATTPDDIIRQFRDAGKFLVTSP